jgi:hypothetical protein
VSGDSIGATSLEPVRPGEGDESAESNEGSEAAEGNGASWRKFADPCLPNAEEQRVHFLTHVPYRSWCTHCVRGKGKKVPPRQER